MSRCIVLSIALLTTSLACAGCGQFGGMFKADVRGVPATSSPSATETQDAPQAEAPTAPAAQPEVEHTDAPEAPRFRDTPLGRLKAELHALGTTSVTALHPELSLDDAHDPRLVASALADGHDPVWLVWTGPVESRSTPRPLEVTLEYRPAPGHYRKGRVEGEGSHIAVRFERGVYAHFGPGEQAVLPVGMPLLVWGEETPGSLVLVSADGAVYRAFVTGSNKSDEAVQNLVPLAQGEVRWPKAPVNTALTSDELIALEEAGVLEAGSRDRVAESQSMAFDCADAVWDAAEPKFQALREKAIPMHARDARMEKLSNKIGAKLPKRCRKELDAVEQAYATVTAPWLEARQAVLDASRASGAQ